MGLHALRRQGFSLPDHMQQESGKSGRNQDLASHQQAHLEWVVHLDIPFFPIKA